MKPTPDQIEEKRLLKVIANTDASAFEVEDAQQRLAAIVERRDPACVYCEKRRSTHEKAICPVVASFQRSHGKGLFPTATQAEAVRKRLADKEEEARRAETKRVVKNNQGRLF